MRTKPIIQQIKPIKPVFAIKYFFTSIICNNPNKPQTNPITISKMKDAYSILNIAFCLSHLSIWTSHPFLPASDNASLSALS